MLTHTSTSPFSNSAHSQKTILTCLFPFPHDYLSAQSILSSHQNVSRREALDVWLYPSSPEQLPYELKRRATLPAGWIKEWDANHNAWYFVDTRQNPPVITWYDPRHSDSSAPGPTPVAGGDRGLMGSLGSMISGKPANNNNNNQYQNYGQPSYNHNNQSPYPGNNYNQQQPPQHQYNSGGGGEASSYYNQPAPQSNYNQAPPPQNNATKPGGAAGGLGGLLSKIPGASGAGGGGGGSGVGLERCYRNYLECSVAGNPLVAAEADQEARRIHSWRVLEGRLLWRWLESSSVGAVTKIITMEVDIMAAEAADSCPCYLAIMAPVVVIITNIIIIMVIIITVIIITSDRFPFSLISLTHLISPRNHCSCHNLSTVLYLRYTAFIRVLYMFV
ncbi:hypothetical protein H4Q26_007377 [Puccinia striiformis f. sp. tritici PST-130]|nr:hypothetical protein H4Q26_007377 [Puccinia striiformis f. sp. tritici PST-130]